MSDNGPRYDWSARATAEIINLFVDSKKSKAELFACILFTILHAMQEAEEELQAIKLEPSEN